MGRPNRIAAGGLIYHVLNRANGRLAIFNKDEDYGAFERVLDEAVRRTGMRLVAYCLMPNHWHLLAWPREDGDLSRFVGWLTLTHTQRWHAHHRTAGTGHLYQGRFKSFPVQSDEHFLTVCRYVERNALRANLVASAADWRWGSLGRRLRGEVGPDALVVPGPIPLPPEWSRRVDEPLTPAEEEALQRSLRRGRPFGRPDWQEQAAERLGLRSTFRPRGRPRTISRVVA
jgi:putative transposase